MAKHARFYHIEFQPFGSDTVQEQIIREGDIYDTFKGIRNLIKENLYPSFEIRSAEGNFREVVQNAISNIVSEHSEYTADMYINSLHDAMESWKESIPVEYQELPLDEFYAASWIDFDSNEHLVFGSEPSQFIEKIFEEIKDVNKLTVREISSSQASVIDDRLNCSKLDKMFDKAVFEDAFKENIQKFANFLLDSRTHWMFVNEPEFRENFTDWVFDRLKYNTKSGIHAVSDEDISSAISSEAYALDSILSSPIEPCDFAMIAETFKFFQNNKYKCAVNYPWVIQPSSDSKFPYDWVLWNDKVPVVMYDSKNRTICPCLSLSDSNYQDICNAIIDAAKKHAGQPILSAADNERYKNVRS